MLQESSWYIRLNPSRGLTQLSLLGTFCRFVEADLGQRDKWLLGDWIKRGHRWDHPSLNSCPALPRHVFCLWFSQLNFAFCISCVFTASLVLCNSAAICIVASTWFHFTALHFSRDLLEREIVHCCPFSLCLFFLLPASLPSLIHFTLYNP